MPKQTTELNQTETLDLVRRMGYLAEYRESGVRSHLERIRAYCRVLSFGLGLTSREVELTSLASMLHDVGKASIPESILVKTGELTAFEWEKVKNHTVIGADILANSDAPVLQIGSMIALSHHERWDGSGYPRSLIGEDIPLSGRICALADVFDALTTKRHYKQEIVPQAALELILDTSGQLFDPKLVKIFHQNFEEILSIRQFNI